ncbi:MAG: peptidylprolyl isomerase [Firmicutes bacterium]|nr:peptidylprolyl isomerase [Bacillota bacterium]
MKADLYPNIAPISVENFVKLVNEKFYDGMIFHRCIDGFMIQGGGYDKTFYDGNFNQKETASIKGEFKQNGVENNLKHTRGVLSMARTQAPDSATSQFFIMHKDTASLDGQYAAFGELTDGFDVLDEIASGETKDLEGQMTYQGQEYDQTMNDVPANPIVIKTIEIVK